MMVQVNQIQAPAGAWSAFCAEKRGIKSQIALRGAPDGTRCHHCGHRATRVVPHRLLNLTGEADGPPSVLPMLMDIHHFASLRRQYCLGITSVAGRARLVGGAVGDGGMAEVGADERVQ